MLRLNTQPYTNVIALRAGLSDAPTRLAVEEGLRKGVGKEWQYMTRTAAASEPSVPGYSARALRQGLCLRGSWDFVKVDIEGGEKRVMEGRTDWLRGTTFYLMALDHHT